jgi:hypothetical protein
MWTRFPVWDKWRDLTRFWIAAETAISAERSRWESLPIRSDSEITIIDRTGVTEFSCNLDEYKTTLNNDHQLYSMLLSSYIGLVEEHGRNLVAHALSASNRPASDFPGLDARLPTNEAAEHYIRCVPVEAWGQAYLGLGLKDWTNLAGGKYGLVEAFVIRNLVSHGLSSISQTAFNRLSACGENAIGWSVGDQVIMDRTKFRHLQWNLRDFARAVAGVGANLTQQSQN